MRISPTGQGGTRNTCPPGQGRLGQTLMWQESLLATAPALGQSPWVAPFPYGILVMPLLLGQGRGGIALHTWQAQAAQPGPLQACRVCLDHLVK
jgi:hypothetical protein